MQVRTLYNVRLFLPRGKPAGETRFRPEPETHT